jgi:hypothetical protein
MQHVHCNVVVSILMLVLFGVQSFLSRHQPARQLGQQRDVCCRGGGVGQLSPCPHPRTLRRATSCP